MAQRKRKKKNRSMTCATCCHSRNIAWRRSFSAMRISFLNTNYGKFYLLGTPDGTKIHDYAAFTSISNGDTLNVMHNTRDKNAIITEITEY